MMRAPSALGELQLAHDHRARGLEARDHRGALVGPEEGRKAAAGARGRLTVVTGPMFAGKSARLIAEAPDKGHPFINSLAGAHHKMYAVEGDAVDYEPDPATSLGAKAVEAVEAYLAGRPIRLLEPESAPPA